VFFSNGQFWSERATYGNRSGSHKKNQRISRRKFLACIPLVFAVQQISEGFVWLSLTHAGYQYLHSAAMYTYLIFAQVVWPVYVTASHIAARKKSTGERKYFPYCLQ